MPIVGPVERLLRARSLARGPRALGGYLDYRDLIACPGAQRRALDGECCGPSAFFCHRHADERRDLAGDELRTLGVGEPRVRPHVGDHDRFATPGRLEDGPSEARQLSATVDGHAIACIRTRDDELVAFDPVVIDAARLEMLAD